MRSAAPTTAGSFSRTVTGVPPRHFWPMRSRCRGACSRRHTRSRAGRSPSSGSRRVGGREEAAAAVASLHLVRGEPSVAAAVLRRRLAATSPDRLDVAAVIELLGEAEIALLDSGAAIERGRALVGLGAVNGCHLIVAHGERLFGHALASTDVSAACRHLEMALAAFVRAGIPYRAAQTRLLLAQVLGRNDREWGRGAGGVVGL